MTKPDPLLVSTRQPMKTWFDRLGKYHQKRLLAIRDAVKSGDALATPTAKNVIEHFKLPVSPQTVTKWFKL